MKEWVHDGASWNVGYRNACPSTAAMVMVSVVGVGGLLRVGVGAAVNGGRDEMFWREGLSATWQQGTVAHSATWKIVLHSQLPKQQATTSTIKQVVLIAALHFAATMMAQEQILTDLMHG